jgi:DNA polymerase III epsilon subunit family exonuclease
MFDLSNCRFAFLDLETTGLSPWFGDRICEVGIVLTEGKRIKGTFETLVNPGRELSPAAASTNGLTDAVLATAPSFEEVAEAVSAHLRDAVVVCHNAQFDLQFLDSEFRRIGREVQIPNLIDTLTIARERFDLPSNTLLSIAEAFHVPMDVSHRALADAITDRGIFFGMLEAIQPPGGMLDEFIGIYNSPAWPNDGIRLPTELSEAIQSGVRLRISYVDGKGQRSKR